LSDSTDGGASETFGLDAELVQEATKAGVDLNSIGLQAVPGEGTSEATPEEASSETAPAPAGAAPVEAVAEAQETPEAAETPTAMQEEPDAATSEPLTREQVETMLAEREKEWQSRKDREVHQIRMEQIRKEQEAQQQAESQQLLAMDPARDGAQYLHAQQERARQPLSPEEISQQAARQIYTDSIVVPLQHSPLFQGRTPEQMQEALAGSGIQFENNPNAAGDVVAWAITEAQKRGVDIGRQQAEATRTGAAAEASSASNTPVDTGEPSGGVQTLNELMSDMDPADFSTVPLDRLEAAAKAQGISNLSDAMFDEAPGIPSNR
jgi:hypothetical protein